MSLAVALPLALIGCRGDDGDEAQSNRYCRIVGVPSSLACSGAPGTYEDCGLALDNNFQTGAAQHANSNVVFDATVGQRGANTLAGVYFFGPTSGTITVSVNTTVNGATQDAGITSTRNFADVASGNTGCNGVNTECTWNDTGGSFIGYRPLAGFDGIRVNVQYTGTESFSVNELCVK